MFSKIFNGAKAHIKGGKIFPEIDGIVTFKEVKDGILLTANIDNLPTSSEYCNGNFFGFHIHDRKFLYRKYK